MNSSAIRVTAARVLILLTAVAFLVGKPCGRALGSDRKHPGPAAARSPVPCCKTTAIFSRLADEDHWLSTVAPLDAKAWKIVCLEGLAGGGTVHAELARSPLWLDIMGVEQGEDLYLEFPEWGISGPVHVSEIRASPQLEPGKGRLVTGAVERILEDSTGVDTLCYLEAYRFRLESERLGDVWDLIEQFRHRARISRNKGTVAYLNLTGRGIYGVNSSLDDDIAFLDEMREMTLRKTWHARLEPTYPYGRVKARYLVHAEGDVLMRAFRELGYLPPEVVLYVDRKTCHWCRAGLGKLMGAMGIRKLKIWQKGIQRPLIMEARDPDESGPGRE